MGQPFLYRRRGPLGSRLEEEETMATMRSLLAKAVEHVSRKSRRSIRAE
jgi:hypothetical protein